MQQFQHHGSQCHARQESGCKCRGGQLGHLAIMLRRPPTPEKYAISLWHDGTALTKLRGQIATRRQLRIAVILRDCCLSGRSNIGLLFGWDQSVICTMTLPEMSGYL